MISTFKLLFEKSWEWNEDKYIAFLDIEKAFDRVPRQKMWDALRDPYYGVSKILKKPLTTPTKISVPGRKHAIKMKTGLKLKLV